jgi:cytochrome c oxidase subunit 2
MSLHLGLVASLSGQPLRSPDSPYFWTPVRGSTVAADTDQLYLTLVWISAIAVIAIFGALTYFVVKYRAKSRTEPLPEKTPDHNTWLELSWSLLPLVVVVVVFVWGFRSYVNLRTTPKDAMEVQVTGQKWKWLFTYSNGMVDDALHVPVGQPVRLVISSADVIHSFYVPAFRVKMDAVPGRYTELWFEATEPGEYPVQCAEYCGQAHSVMVSKVVVHPEGGFEKWLASIEDKLKALPPVELGKLLAEKQGCLACHSTDGSPMVGPTWKGIFGTARELQAGGSVTADENYLRSAILTPQAEVVRGFAPVMPTYQGKLSDHEINGLIEYIKSLK